MTQVAQYVRMSSDQQLLSISMQIEAIATYANAHGYRIVRTYTDEAKSGVVLSGRTSMQRLLEDVEKRPQPFDAVLVLDVTRWGRFQDVDESAYYEYHCRKHGVNVIYVAESFRPGIAPIDSLIKQMKRTMAGEYSRELAVKTRSAQMATVSLGFPTGSMPCIGYRRRVVSPDGELRQELSTRERKPKRADHVTWTLGPPEEVAFLQSIFHQFAHENRPILALERQALAAGLRTHQGKVLTRYCIRRLLVNEIVIGTFKWGTRGRGHTSITNIPPLPESMSIEGMVPALVDLETWEKTQARLMGYCRARHYGQTRELMLERIRERMAECQISEYRDFRCVFKPWFEAIRRLFGNVRSAYLASVSEVPASSSRVSQWISKQFLGDVGSLLREAQIDVDIDLRRNVLSYGGLGVKVRSARSLFGTEAGPWYLHHTHTPKSDGFYTLVLRLNLDNVTGKDFYLLPPAVCKNFTGRFSTKVEAQLAEFRFTTADQLVVALRGVLTGSAIQERSYCWSA